jgi:mannose-1-phosphate guanylyltransferase/mannose-6-phosphate isomerase
VNVQPVILCGGSGTRLWPLSRYQFPKQLLAIGGDDSMLQATALRMTQVDAWPEVEILPPIVVTNEEYRFVTAEQLRERGVSPAAVVLEPVGRNTAPALTVAAHHARSAGGDPILLVMPADHVISDLQRFRQGVREGSGHAGRGAFVTFGIAPTQPHTGYGYLRVAGRGADEAMRLRAFVEKPDRDAAERYIESGDYLWNSGIFMMQASAWLGEIEAARPAIARACEAACAQATRDRDFVRLDTDAFRACPSESIDYAVMEGLGTARASDARPVVVVPLDAGWSDLGAWGALWDIAPKDEYGNVARGDAHLVATRDSLVFGADRLVACIGLTDTVVIDTPDALLVAHRERVEEVKDVVASLKAGNRPEADSHRKVYRPWGSYDTIDCGPRFQVKRIVVNPGAALSLQMHHHRAEHWIVVTGTAQVTRGEEVFVLSENQSTYIPLGTKHRLENPGKVPLELIEVQSGAYLGEDDIVRFEDAYGRS